MNEIYFILIWILLWFSAWAFINVWMFNRNYDYIHNNHITTMYFIFLTLISILIFQKYLTNIWNYFSLQMIILYLFFWIFIICLLFRIKEKYKSVEKFVRKPNFFLFIDTKYYSVKFWDIIWQQLMIFIFYILIKNYFNENIALYSGIIFAVIHLPMIYYKKIKDGWIFPVASFFGMYIFITLIESSNYGLIYSWFVHWLFYFNWPVIWRIYKYHQQKDIIRN